MIKKLISLFKFIWINLLKLNNLLASPQRVTSIKTIIEELKPDNFTLLMELISLQSVT